MRMHGKALNEIWLILFLSAFQTGPSVMVGKGAEKVG